MAEERVQRRLAAILAADVVSYSRLMEADEAGTLAALKARRRDVLSPLVVRHQGRIFKVTGDGVLVEFGSAVSAVQCAIDLQRGMAAANKDESQDRQIVLRIGVNLGDVMIEGTDFYGEGVNIAARLEGIAQLGGICISAKVHDEVWRKLGLVCEDLGEQQLKNIATPIRAFSLVRDATRVFATEGLPLPAKPSIAVLPFVNMSGDPEQQYFSDGITEDIISGLARLHWLFVIARNSSFIYMGKAIDVRQVGRELGVRYLLDGSVRRAGERIRITCRLVDATSGAHIWTDRFDGALQDIFDLQDRITANVIGAIEPKLRHAEIERARQKPTESVDAYDLFLRAVALHHTRKREDNEEALRLLGRVMAIDQNYASAYALAAHCVFRLRVQGWVPPSDPVVVEGMRMARLAAEKGRDDPEALWMAGFALSLLSGEFGEGLALLERSLVLNPNSANAWMGSGVVRAYLGDCDTAILHLEKSARLSPLDPWIFGTWIGFAIAHFVAGRYEEASAWCDKTLQEAPDFPSALRMKVAICGLLDRLEEGRIWTKRLLAVTPNANLSSLRTHYRPFFKKPGTFDALVEGLRKAGVPE